MNWKDVSKSTDMQVILRALEELDIEERDERGRTPLMLLLTNRAPIQAIASLIERGADLEAEDKLGDTALKKAVKFKQIDALKKLIDAGAKLDSRHGILATAWHAARYDSKLADLLLDTEGAVRLTLTAREQAIVDEILYEESIGEMCRKIQQLESSVILHAIVNGYNWDDGPEPMLCAFHNPNIQEISLLDMFELLEGDYWLSKDTSELHQDAEDLQWKALAAALDDRLQRNTHL